MATALGLFISSLLHLNYLIPVGLCKSHLIYIMLLNATLPLTFWNSDTIETSSCEQTEDLEVHRILQKVLPVKVSGPRLCNESLAVWGFSYTDKLMRMYMPRRF